MLCRSVKAQLFDYLDQTLPPLTMKRVSKHVQGCPDCAAELQKVKSLKLSLNTMPDLEAPAFMWDRIKYELTGTVREKETIWTKAQTILDSLKIPQYSWLPVAFAAIFMFAIMFGNNQLPYRYRDLNGYLNEEVWPVYNHDDVLFLESEQEGGDLGALGL
ncbi:anti-sigma factor family protein [Candidatus Margulisiibacteriota bacterium]